MSKQKDSDEQPHCATVPKGAPTQYCHEISENDVLLGRGAPIINNEGNRRFREIVRSRKEDYCSTNSRKQKDRIARQVVAEISSRNGCFLRQVESLSEGDTEGKWKIAEFQVALEKCKQALRDKEGERQSSRLHTDEPAPTAALDDAQSDAVTDRGSGNLVSAALVHQQNLHRRQQELTLLAQHQQLQALREQHLQRDTVLSHLSADSLWNFCRMEVARLSAPPHVQFSDDQVVAILQRQRLLNSLHLATSAPQLDAPPVLPSSLHRVQSEGNVAILHALREQHSLEQNRMLRQNLLGIQNTFGTARGSPVVRLGAERVPRVPTYAAALPKNPSPTSSSSSRTSSSGGKRKKAETTSPSSEESTNKKPVVHVKKFKPSGAT